jgi:PIN domain nuclease of toxin-antitoxin system
LWQWRAEWLGMGLREIAVTGELSLAAGALEDFHGDPADRLIAVTAQRLELPLCTADERLLACLPQLARVVAKQ